MSRVFRFLGVADDFASEDVNTLNVTPDPVPRAGLSAPVVARSVLGARFSAVVRRRAPALSASALCRPRPTPCSTMTSASYSRRCSPRMRSTSAPHGHALCKLASLTLGTRARAASHALGQLPFGAARENPCEVHELPGGAERVAYRERGQAPEAAPGVRGHAA